MILFKKVIETHGPFDKGGSGVAAKNQCHRFLPPEIREANGIFPVCVAQIEIRSNVSGPGCVGIKLLLPDLGFLSIMKKSRHGIAPFQSER